MLWLLVVLSRFVSIHLVIAFSLLVLIRQPRYGTQKLVNVSSHSKVTVMKYSAAHSTMRATPSLQVWVGDFLFIYTVIETETSWWSNSYWKKLCESKHAITFLHLVLTNLKHKDSTVVNLLVYLLFTSGMALIMSYSVRSFHISLILVIQIHFVFMLIDLWIYVTFHCLTRLLFLSVGSKDNTCRIWKWGWQHTYLSIT